jgi:hypothetical protein
MPTAAEDRAITAAARTVGAEKSEAELMMAGDELEAKGVKLVSGAKVVASLTRSAAKAITLRFSMK